MDDLISRQAAINTVRSHYRNHDNDLLEVVEHELSVLPSIQPKRATGEWLHVDINSEDESDMKGWMPWYCSECGAGVGKHQTTFCPNCGADMRGGKE